MYAYINFFFGFESYNPFIRLIKTIYLVEQTQFVVLCELKNSNTNNYYVISYITKNVIHI